MGLKLGLGFAEQHRGARARDEYRGLARRDAHLVRVRVGVRARVGVGFWVWVRVRAEGWAVARVWARVRVRVRVGVKGGAGAHHRREDVRGAGERYVGERLYLVA